MRNNHFFKTQIVMAAIVATVIAPFCAFSQQKTAARTTTIKDSDIYVPDKVLEPSGEPLRVHIVENGKDREVRRSILQNVLFKSKQST